MNKSTMRIVGTVLTAAFLVITPCSAYEHEACQNEEELLKGVDETLGESVMKAEETETGETVEDNTVESACEATEVTEIAETTETIAETDGEQLTIGTEMAEAESEEAEPAEQEADLFMVNPFISSLDVVKPEWCFQDVKPNDWFYYDVEFVYNRGIITGKTNTIYDPASTVSRAMAAKIFYRVATAPMEIFDCTFFDVREGFWYTTCINWANQHGVMTGYGNGFFGPDDKVTREQFVTVMYRYSRKIGMTDSKGSASSLDKYPDSGRIHDYARDAMIWAVNSGIVGKNTALLNPRGAMTRAEVAAIVRRFIEKYHMIYSTNYHIHKSGMPIPHWYQDDGIWSAHPYGNGLMRDNACGPTCVAMIASYFLRERITPLDIVQDIGNDYWAGNGSTDRLIDTYMKNRFGVRTNYLGADVNKIIQEVQKGRPVIALLNSNSWRTSSGHFVVIRGISEDGKSFMISDPIGENQESRSEERRDSFEEIQNSLKRAWSCY